MHVNSKKHDNILLISCFGSLQGGGQRSLLLLLRTLDRSCFQTLVTVPESGELADACRQLDIPIFIIEFPRLRSLRFFSIKRAVLRLRNLFRQNKIAIVHTDSPRETWYAWLASRFLNIKVLLHARVTDSVPWEDWLLVHLIDAVICVSKTVSKRFSPSRRAKVHVVYNSVDYRLFNHPTVFRDNGPLRVGYFGRLHPRKGISVLIRAVNELGADVECIIQGSGDLNYEQELKGLSGKSVRFFSYQPDVTESMSGVDVVVLPNLKKEGLSRMLIEAMALGKAVIASDFPTSREVLGEHLYNWLVPSGDVEALTEKIKTLVQQRSLLNEISSIARQRAERLFNAEVNTRQVEKVYEQMLEGSIER